MHFLSRPIPFNNRLWLFAIVGWLTLLPLGVVQAQTGPGGVGNGAGAPGQPRNIVWLDAASLELSDGDAVGTWTDRSGNGYDATRSNAAQQPRYTMSILNGRSIIRFDGTDDALNLDAAINTNSDGIVNRDYSFILVGARRTSASNDGWLLYGSGAFDAESNLYVGWRDGDPSSFRYSQFGATEMQVAPGDYTNNGVNQYAVFTGTFGQTESPARSLYENGTLIGTNGSTQVLTSYPGAELGGLKGSNECAVDIAEAIFYQDVLNDAQRSVINNYLSAKYDLPVQTERYVGDTPANGNFDYDVAGIGQEAGSQHTEANSTGFIIRANSSLDANGEFLLAGHNNTSHSITTANLPATVQERWARSWYVDKTGSLSADFTFDLEAVHPGETFNGDADRYVLLRWDGATYQEVPISNANKSATATTVNFTVGDSDLVDGIYTIGTQAAVSAPLAGISRKGTGPGGVGNAQGTDGQPENAMWLDARAQPYGDGVLVREWFDQSGNGNHANQSNYRDLPQLRTGVANTNGNPVIRFDGDENNDGNNTDGDYLSFDGNVVVGTDYTVITVVAPRTFDGFRTRWMGAANGNADGNLNAGWHGTNRAYTDHLGSDYRYNLRNAEGASLGSFGIFMHGLEQSSSQARTIYQNGELLGSNNNFDPLLSYANARLATNFTREYDVDIAEFIIYPTALNRVQRTIVNNYLSAKYDIPLYGTDHLDYYSGDDAANEHHDFGMIGIGQQDGHRHLQANGRGLALTAEAPSLSNDEFLLVGHNDAKPEGTTANVGAGIAERLTRTWYVDKTGSVDASLTFELQEVLTKHTFSKQASDYVLLRRNGATFEEVSGTTAQLTNNRLTFELTDTQLTDGVYTIGTRSATATPIAGFAVPETVRVLRVPYQL